MAHEFFLALHFWRSEILIASDKDLITVNTAAKPFTVTRHPLVGSAQLAGFSDRNLCYVSSDGALRIVDLHTGVSKQVQVGDARRYSVIACSPDGTIALARSSEVIFVSTRGGIDTVRLPSKWPISMCFSRNGRSIAVGTLYGEVIIFDRQTKMVVQSVKVKGGAPARTLTPSSKQATFVAGAGQWFQEVGRAGLLSARQATPRQDLHVSKVNISDSGRVWTFDLFATRNSGKQHLEIFSRCFVDGKRKMIAMLVDGPSSLCPSGQYLGVVGPTGILGLYTIASGTTRYINLNTKTP